MPPPLQPRPLLRPPLPPRCPPPSPPPCVGGGGGTRVSAVAAAAAAAVVVVDVPLFRLRSVVAAGGPRCSLLHRWCWGGRYKRWRWCFRVDLDAAPLLPPPGTNKKSHRTTYHIRTGTDHPVSTCSSPCFSSSPVVVAADLAPVPSPPPPPPPPPSLLPLLLLLG